MKNIGWAKIIDFCLRRDGATDRIDENGRPAEEIIKRILIQEASPHRYGGIQNRPANKPPVHLRKLAAA